MNEFISTTSFNLAGSVVAVILLMNTIRHVLGWGPRWLGILFSIGISFAAYSLAPLSDAGNLKYLIILLNACLIYTSAFGLQNTVVNSLAGQGKVELLEPKSKPSKEEVVFTSEW